MSPPNAPPTEPVAGESGPRPTAGQPAADAAASAAATTTTTAADAAAAAGAPQAVPADLVADFKARVAEVRAEVAAAAAAAIAGGTVYPVTAYDWHTPHRFTASGRGKLAAFAVTAAARISADLKELFRRETRLAADTVVELYGADAWNPGRTPLYAVPLKDAADRVVGMVGLAPATALGWTERLLGGTSSETTGVRQLSPLESALLLDIVAAMVKGFAAALQESGGPAIHHVEAVSSDKSPLAGLEGEEFCRLNLTAGSDQADPCAWLAVRSDLLDALVEPAALKKQPRSAEDTRKDLRSYVEYVPVRVTARLGASAITMRDIASLEPGDVLVLDRAMGEPIQLLAMGKVLMQAIPVTCDGWYAVQVVERREDPRLRLVKKENPE